MTSVLEIATQNQTRAINPEASVWVSASAGTGKTKVLTDRVLALLLAGTQPHRILCLTFTKAAAAEMSNRLLALLSKWTIAEDAKLVEWITPLLSTPPTSGHLQTARQLFARVLDVPGGMHIETIHAFCQSLLRRFPVEAGLSPHFRVMDDTDAKEILAEIQKQVLATAQNATESELAKALNAVTNRIHESRFPDLIEALTANRGQIARMLQHYNGLAPTISALCNRLGVTTQDRPHSILASACDESAFDGAALRHAVSIQETGKTTDQKNAQIMARWLSSPVDRVATFSEYSSVFLTQKGDIRKTLITSDLSKKHPTVIDALSEEAFRILAVHETLNALETRDATHALLILGKALLDAYDQKKQRLATLDYDDLIYNARTLLDRDGISAWVLYKLDGGIDHVLIDEAQDTNPDQWAVVRALTLEFFSGLGGRDECRTIFAVGDAKQSIYSFQRADPAEFAAMRHFFSEKVIGANHRWEDVDLLVSFRSTQSVLDAVNAIFSPASPARDGVAEPTEDIDHLAARQGQAGSVEVWPPIAVRPLDGPAPWKPPIERIRADSPSQRLATLIAERIGSMIGTESLGSRGRPVRAGDCLVLVRKRGAFVEDLIRALKARSIPVAGADRMILATQIAVMDLMALGACLLLPQDDLTLATVLKSPLIGLSEDDLFQLAWNRNDSLWDALRVRSADMPVFAKAWDRLTTWLYQSDHLTPFDFYSNVLGADGGRERLASRLGPEAEDPIDEFLSLALTFQNGHPPSLQGFLHWLESAGIQIKRDLEQGTIDAVRIMTVHGSKGLQAPIVFLPDTLQTPHTSSSPLIWLDQKPFPLVAWPPKADTIDPQCAKTKHSAAHAQMQEYHRLLYVAATRAEDRLIVCGYGGRKSSQGNWYESIKSSLDPIAGIADDPTLSRLQETDSAAILKIHQIQTALPDRDQTLGSSDAYALNPLPPWARAAPLGEPSPPRPLSPSKPDGIEPTVRSPLDKQHSKALYRRGTLIHRLLQTLPDLFPKDRARAAQKYLAKAAADWDAGLRVNLAAEVEQILDHPGFQLLFGTGSLAEVPVAGLIGGKAIAGVVDRLIVTETEVLIVDYKTNRRPPLGDEPIPSAYIHQMAAYRLALACIYPRHKVRCALVWTDGPQFVELEAQTMDDALTL